MNIPGFTAEESLRELNTRYQANAGAFARVYRDRLEPQAINWRACIWFFGWHCAHGTIEFE